jgi:hypothetical protein
MQELPPGFKIIGIKPYYNERAKLPNKKFYTFPKHVEFPFCDVEIIKKIINNNLTQIEGLRGEYNEKKYIWDLEFGTKPIERTIDKADYKLVKIINRKKEAAMDAAIKAQDKFPHNNNYDNDELPPPPFNLKWMHMNILLSYDEEKNTILVEFNRLIGESTSYYFVANIIEHALKEIAFVNWIKRAAYLMFTEGIEYNPKNPILKYLCDDMVKREICSCL